MIKLGKLDGNIQGLGNFDNGITALQYADDAVIFSVVEPTKLWNLKLLLYLFENVFGLNINYDKTEAVWLEGSNDKQEEIAAMFNCKQSKLPLNYLGIPLKVGQLNIQEWKPLVDRVENRLPSWKGSTLSRGGRLTLINDVLTSIPSYWMSFFILPSWVVDRIDKIRRVFLWNGSSTVSGIKCLRNWDSVCRSKSQGGLGIINIKQLNVAIIGK